MQVGAQALQPGPLAEPLAPLRLATAQLAARLVAALLLAALLLAGLLLAGLLVLARKLVLARLAPVLASPLFLVRVFSKTSCLRRSRKLFCLAQNLRLQALQPQRRLSNLFTYSNLDFPVSMSISSV